MGIATGNPTWEDYPSTNTPITADRLNNIETAIDGRQPATQPINAQTGTYTLTASDAGKLVTMNSAAAATITVPGGVFSTGQRVDVLDIGAGRVTFLRGADMTLHGDPSLISRAQHSAHTVVFLSPNEAVVVGDLA